MARQKRENTKKVLLTLSDKQIEWGKIQAVKEKVSFSEFVDNLLIQAESRLTERREKGSTAGRPKKKAAKETECIEDE